MTLKKKKKKKKKKTVVIFFFFKAVLASPSTLSKPSYRLTYGASPYLDGG